MAACRLGVQEVPFDEWCLKPELAGKKSRFPDLLFSFAEGRGLIKVRA